MTPERTASGKALDVTLVLKLQITEPFSKLARNSCCYFLPPPSLNSHQPTVINFLSVVLFPFASNGKVFFSSWEFHTCNRHLSNFSSTTYFINDFQLWKKFSLIAAIVQLFTKPPFTFYPPSKVQWSMVFFTHQPPLEMEKEITCRRCVSLWRIGTILKSSSESKGGL